MIKSPAKKASGHTSPTSPEKPEKPEPPNQDWGQGTGGHIKSFAKFDLTGEWLAEPAVEKTDCGNYAFNFGFYLHSHYSGRKIKGHNIFGYIIQEVTITQDIFWCDSCEEVVSKGRPPEQRRGIDDLHFWEAWRVKSGTYQKKTLVGTDSMSHFTSSDARKTYGRVKFEGEARFFPSYRLHGFRNGVGSHVAAGLPYRYATEGPPQGWNSPWPSISHSYEVEWNCCCAGNSCSGAPMRRDSSTTQWLKSYSPDWGVALSPQEPNIGQDGRQ